MKIINKSAVAVGVTAALGVGATAMAPSVSAATLADGFYDMTINNTTYSSLLMDYSIGSDGAWASSFTFSCAPGLLSCGSNALYDDNAAKTNTVNGMYAGNPGDGLQGTVGLRVEGGVITGTGAFEFDTIPGTAGGNFAEYGGSSGFTGTITASGAITLTPTGTLGAVSDFPALVDKAWNVNNFNGGGFVGTNFVPNAPTNNTTYDSFSTGTATNAAATINGAVYDGTTAILVKGGSIGNTWGGFFGAQYLEAWNVGFTFTGELPAAIPVPAAVWLFGSGLVGLVGVARRKKQG